MRAAIGSFEPVAIVGYGCVVPNALTPEALWSIAATGASAITTVSDDRWGVPPERLLIDATAAERREGCAADRGGLVRGFAERFDPEGFAIDAAGVRAGDNLTRWLLHAGREALRAAGRDRRPTAFRRGGAIVGNLGYPTDELAAFTSAVWDGEPAANPIHRFNTGRPAETLAAALGLDAGGFALDAACASSLYAIKLACDRLHDGAADFMLAGAVNRIQSITLFGGFTALGALSPSGRSRPFHRHADGLLPAEGAVLFVLKRLTTAIADGDDIRAVIRGIGLSNDGRGKGLLVPRADGQLAAMRAAYAAADRAPADVSFVECHATGTQLGDATELESMGTLFAGLREVPIGSFKANLGHLVTASGGAGLIKVVEGMRHGIRPGTPGIDDVTDRLAASPFRLLHTAEPWAVAGPRIAGVSSFGFGGNNAHLVVEEWTGAEPRAFAVPAAPAPRPRVAIVALAAQLADGADADAFRLHLLAGKRRGTNDGAPAAAIAFGPREVRIAPNDMRKTLPQHLLALRVAIDAAAATTTLPIDRTSAYVGTTCDPEVTRFGRRLRRDDLGSDLCARETGLGAVDATSVLGAMPNMPANRISAHLDLKGPSFVVFREERSGYEALLLAERALAAGEIDAAIVASADLSCEPAHATAIRALFPPTFHRPGDGAVAFVLKREADALRDGDAVLATIDRATDDALSARDVVVLEGASVAERTRATFGHVHAAASLIDVAAAVVALRDGIVPPSTAGDGTAALPWLAMQPRRMRVAASAATGAEAIVLAEGDGTRRTPYFPRERPTLRWYGAESRAALLAAVDDDRAQTASLRAATRPAHRLAIVATAAGRAERIASAAAYLRAGAAAEGAAPPGVFYGTGDPEGDLAFVFTGSSAAYAGMGRDLLLAYPELVDAVSNRYVGAEGLVMSSWIFQGGKAKVDDFQRLAGTTLLSQAHAVFLGELLGIVPEASIGLSSGETNALFAFGAWTDMSGFFADIRASRMYDRDLGGAYETVRGYWAERGLPPGVWATWHIAAAPEAIARVIGDDPAVAITIVNAPTSTVIAGERAACERVAAAFGSGLSTPIEVELACHTRAIADYAPTWRALHSRPTRTPAGIRFYANATGSSYELDRERAADLLTEQAVGPIDFPRTIRRAWDDGVRTFVELGPRDHCTRAIDEILADRAHRALALDVVGTSSLQQVLAVTAALIAHGIPVDLDRLRAEEPPAPLAPPPAYAVPAHLPAVTARRDARVPLPRAPILAPPPVRRPLARAALVDTGPPGVRIGRRGLETLASGRISDVFGPTFSGQDAYALQVRMPEMPLLLADRVVGLVGIPGRMDTGTIWTETDVRADAWHFRHDRMPIGIMIESGQADLLAISWLGIDRINRGERAYRLLGCDLTFADGLPRAGETLRYDIHVDGHANLGATSLFFFHYDCRVDDVVRLRVRNGQAGFFTTEELANSAGVLWSATDDGAGPPADAPYAPPRVPTRAAFGAAAMAAFFAGDVYGCFGAGFERAASHTRTPQMPQADPTLLGEVTAFDPAGGPWGRGYLRLEKDVGPEDWFFEGHFKNDPVMPGTLQLDGAFGAMAFYLTALGYTLERDAWRFEPVLDEAVRLVCRGQILPTSRRIVAELFIHDVTDGPIPTLHADLLSTVDGKKCFHGRKLGLRLVPDYPLAPRPAGSLATIRDEHAMLACAFGLPADAFGAAFAARFPATRHLQRLPGPPLLLMSRLRSIAEAPDGEAVGTAVVAELDLAPEDWFFHENGARVMPFVALLEAALQPCGWLISYVGATVPRDHVLLLRNLDGAATVHAEVRPEDGMLVTEASIGSISQVGPITLGEFAIVCHAGGKRVFSGTTTFGVFPESMLVDQVGLPVTPADRAAFDAPANVAIDLRSSPAAFFGTPRLAEGKLLMLDRITGLWPSGGAAGLGLARGELAIEPRSWMFKAHFFGDPVQPGSLGIEALVQLLQATMLNAGLHAGMAAPRFEALAVDDSVVWRYRGQVVPTNRLVTTVVEILAIDRDERGVVARAAGTLFVDGKKIYHLARFGVRLTDGDPHEPGSRSLVADATIDLASAPWLRDHAPSQKIPVVPMAEILDRIAAAATTARPRGMRLVEVADVRLQGWMIVGDEPLGLRVTVEPIDGAWSEVTVAVRRKAPRPDGSAFNTTATARVHYAADAGEAPAAWTELDAPVRHDGSGLPGRDMYRDGALFHGPVLEVLRHARIGPAGSSAVLDAEPAPLADRGLNPRLLDGLVQGVPYDQFGIWNGRATAGFVGFPSRVVALRLFGAVPTAGTVRSETRYRGPDGESGRFERVEIQGIRADGTVWCTLDLVIVLVSIGRFGAIPRGRRWAFLDGTADDVPTALADRVPLADGTGVATTTSAADVAEADWIRGSIAAVYRLPQADARTLAATIAVQEHAAHALGVHPSRITVDADGTIARCRTQPYYAQRVRSEPTAAGRRVVDDGPAYADLAPLRSFFARRAGSGDSPMAHLVAAFVQGFASSLVFADEATRDAVAARPTLFVANHQVVVESALFANLMAPLQAHPLEVMTRSGFRTSSFGQWDTLLQSIPDAAFPAMSMYVERDDPAALYAAMERFRASLPRRSLLVHAEGEYARSCAVPVKRIGASIIDLAIGLDLLVVPVRFVGGLPIEPASETLVFPYGFGKQRYLIGRAIDPGDLAALSLIDRVRAVRDAVNAIAPRNADEAPSAPQPDLERAVRERAARGVSLPIAAAHELIARHDPRDGFDMEPIRRIMRGELDPRPAHRAWESAFRAWLSGDTSDADPIAFLR